MPAHQHFHILSTYWLRGEVGRVGFNNFVALQLLLTLCLADSLQCQNIRCIFHKSEFLHTMKFGGGRCEQSFAGGFYCIYILRNQYLTPDFLSTKSDA